MKPRRRESTFPSPFWWSDDFSPLQHLGKELNEVLSQNFGNRWPSAEVVEEDREILLRIEIPGVEAKDLDVRVTGETVVIKGEVQENHRSGTEGQQYYHSERRYGHFLRSISLPAEVKPDSATARYANGILEIQIGKQEDRHTEGRKVPVE